MKKRKNLIFLTACLAVSAIALGTVQLNANFAQADELTPFSGEQTVYVDDSGNIYATETVNTTKVDFKMEMAYGAAIRTVEGEGKIKIKYSAKKDKINYVYPTKWKILLMEAKNEEKA